MNRDKISRPGATPEEKRGAMFEAMQEELKTIEQIQKDVEEGDCDDFDEHEDYRDPLEVTLEKTIKIGLSYGGPADGFRLHYRNNELNGGVYYFQDWGVYEEIELSQGEALTVEDFYLQGEPSLILDGTTQ